MGLQLEMENASLEVNVGCPPHIKPNNYNFHDLDFIVQGVPGEVKSADGSQKAQELNLDEWFLQEGPEEQQDVQENVLFVEENVLPENPRIQPVSFHIDGLDFIHEDEPIQPALMDLVELDDEYMDFEKIFQIQVPQPEAMDLQSIPENPVARSPFGSESPGVLHFDRDGQLLDGHPINVPLGPQD